MLADLVPTCRTGGSRHYERGRLFGAAVDPRAVTAWHKATDDVRQDLPSSGRASASSRVSTSPNWRYSSRSQTPDMTTCVTGSANPDRIAQWAEWADHPLGRAVAGRSVGDPRTHPQLVLHRGPAGKQRPSPLVMRKVTIHVPNYRRTSALLGTRTI